MQGELISGGQGSWREKGEEGEYYPKPRESTAKNEWWLRGGAPSPDSSWKLLPILLPRAALMFCSPSTLFQPTVGMVTLDTRVSLSLSSLRSRREGELGDSLGKDVR